jgi:hypothetical protein
MSNPRPTCCASAVGARVPGSVVRAALRHRAIIAVLVVCAAQTAIAAPPLIPSWLSSFGSQSTTPHPSVAQVVATERNSLAQGSGTLVAVSEQHGLVLTNWHVVRDAAGPIRVIFPDGFQSAAQVLKLDDQWDLAALLIWRPRSQPVALAATPPRPGDAMTIAGYGPGSYRAASGRCTQYVAPGPNMPYEMVEVSASARQGDSGGPMFNDRGELAGVLFGSSGGTTSGSHCGRVRTFLQPLWPDIAGGKRQIPASPAMPPNDASSDSMAPLPPPPVDSDDPADLASNGTLPADDSTLAVAQAVLPQGAFSVPRADLSPSANQQWLQYAGKTPLEQAKTALAGIGLLAVVVQLSRWLSRGQKKQGEGK